jgi:multidrug efflux pump subunit AcrA (membrane-fusion protein)
VVDRATRTFMARVHLPNPQHRLRVGQSAMVLARRPPRDILVLPARAILPTPGGRTAVFRVFSAPSGTGYVASRQEIQAHWLKDGRVEVHHGLKSGDRVVVSGASWLLEGDPVTQAGQTPGSS